MNRTGILKPLTSSDAAVESLLQALDEQIEATDSEEEKGKLRALRASVLQAGREIVSEVLAKLIAGQI